MQLRRVVDSGRRRETAEDSAALRESTYLSLGLSLHLGLHLSLGLMLSLCLGLGLDLGCLYGGHPRRCRLLGEQLCLLLSCLSLGLCLLHFLRLL